MSDKIPTGQNEREENCQDSTQSKKQFKEPRLEFIKPKLTKYGEVTKIISGFVTTIAP